jgi:50S ribosomal protein L16 3-hydroxylase
VAHYGVALEDCLTYSVGFRAPAQRDLVGDLFNLPEALLGAVASDTLYADPDLVPAAEPGEITPAAVARVAALARAPLERDDVLGRWFAAHVTRPPLGVLAPTRRRPSPAALKQALAGGREVWRSDAGRLAYLRAPKGRLFLYASGAELEVEPALLPLIRTLCGARRHAGRALLKLLPPGRRRTLGLALLADLVQRGIICLPGR